MIMNFYKLMTTNVSLAVIFFMLAQDTASAVEPQALFDFTNGPGTVTGTLVQGPDGNFYGTTIRGGPTQNGTVFRVTPAGALTILVSDQFNPAAGLAVGNDGLLYGMTGLSGAPGWGTAFKMTTGGVFTNFAVFNGVNAGNPQAGLVLARDGNFYGASQEGGTNGAGNVFRVTPGGVVTSLVSFDITVLGGFPLVSLTLGADSNLYGMTTDGGTNGLGTIFKLTTGGAFTTIYSFQSGDGFTRHAALTQGPDGNLYGVSGDGGTADLGTVFRVSTSGAFTNLVSFNGTNGESPLGQLAVGPDGQLYGTTQLGGSAASAGTVFKVSTSGALTTLVIFSNAFSGVPEEGLLLANDGNFYGCTEGAVFKMTPAGALTTVAPLIPPGGVNPESGLIQAADGNFYGTARNGGNNNQGAIFKVTPNGVLTPLFSFGGTNGGEPQAALAIGLDGNFYGTTQLGGSNNFGTIFRFSTNGTFASLASFNGTNGGDPQCQLVMDSAGNFYGTAAEQGGPALAGTIFRVTTNGALTKLVTFNGTNGASPEDGLTAGNDGNFYGTTTDGGAHGQGTVFKITPGGDLTTIFSFNGTNGGSVLGGLVLGKDGILYGTAGFGGTNLSFGTIFKITTGGDFTPLYNFHFTDGSEPTTKMVQGNDGNLYGTTTYGGDTGGNIGGTGFGSVFRISTNGAFAPLIIFHGTNGANPQAPLLVGNDGNLYGTTFQGGPGGGGALFIVSTASQFTGLTKMPGGMVVSGTGLPGESYHLYGTTNLLAPFASWPLVTSSVLDTNGQFSYTDTSATNLNQRFYRISTP
jgi:uncharacterized repeat protein (TIGR03803 family)